MSQPGIDRRVALFVEAAAKAERHLHRMASVPAWLVALVPLVWPVTGGGLPDFGNFILAGFLFWGIYKLGKRVARSHLRRFHADQAEKFRREFSATSSGYDNALRRLIRTQRDERVVKAMLEHLPGAAEVMAETGGGAVWYDAVKSPAKSSKPAQAKPSAASGPVPSQVFDEMFNTMVLPGLGSLKSRQEVLDMIKDNPNLEATFSEGKTETGGTFTTVRIVQTGTNMSYAVGGPAPGKLMGPMATPPKPQAEPAPLPTEDKPRKAAPGDRPAFIPLDPFDADDPADED